MKLLVCGDRHRTNVFKIREEIMKLHEQTPISLIIEGEAKGADTIGRLVAEELGISVKKFPANWNEYGRAAGPIRNRQMLDEGPDMVYAFHNNIDQSKGTKNMISIAKAKSISVKLFTETT